MSFYIAVAKDLKERKASSVFYWGARTWFRRSSNKVEVALENADSDLDNYISLAEFAIEKRIFECEIKVNLEGKNTEFFPSLLKKLASFLVDKDLSFGILIDENGLIQNNKQLISKLGINVSKRPIDNVVCELEAAPMDPLEYVPLVHASRGKDKRMLLKAQRPAPTIKPARASLDLGHINLDESFRDKLMKHLIESGKTNAEIYHKAGVSKQVFSKIISTPDMIPSKSTVLCLAIGLELSLIETNELLQAAGYALSKSIISDAIVARYIRMGVYNLDRINADLDEYGCPLLGWKPRED